MPTLSVGKRSSRRDAGVTLIEMLVVVSLIAIVAGIGYPAMSSGIETLRLNAATQSIVVFINAGLNRAERRQQLVEVTISKADNTLSLQSSEPGFERKLELPDGVKIENVLPELADDEDANAPRTFMLYPGGSVPAFGVALVNAKRSQRIVRVDPITGVPRVEAPAAAEQ